LENQSKIDVTLQPDLSDLDEVNRCLDMVTAKKASLPEQFPLWVVKKYKIANYDARTGLFKVEQLAWM